MRDAATAGRALRSVDLQAAQTYLSAFSAACEVVGTDPDTATVQELTAIHEAKHAKAWVRDQLLDLTTLQAAPNLTGQVAVLGQFVQRLLTGDNLDPDSPETTAMLELHALVADASVGGHDDDDLLERATRLKQILPEQVEKLAAAAGFGRLSFAERTPGSGHARTAGADERRNTTGREAPGEAALVCQPATPSQPPTRGAHRRPPAAQREQQVATPAAIAPASSSGTAPAVPSASPPDALAHAAPADSTAPRAAFDEVRSDERVHDLAVVKAVNDLLVANRLGLAYHLLGAVGATAHADAVYLATLASAAQTSAGPCALELLEMLEALDDTDELQLAPDVDTALINAAALTQTAIITGSTHAARLLGSVADRLDPAWTRLARLANEAGSSGALTHPAARPLGNTQVEQARVATRQAADSAAARRSQTFHLRTPRATTLLAELRTNPHPFGVSLRAAADNDAAQADRVREQLSPMTRDMITALTSEADRQSRGRGRGLTSDDRREILEALVADRAAALRWAEVARAAMGGRSLHDWSAARLGKLREHLLDRGEDLRAALRIYGSGGEIAQGAAALAERALERMQTLVTGEVDLSRPEPTPNTLLNLELLKIDSAKWDPSGSKVDLDPEQHRVDTLLPAAQEDDYRQAMKRRIDNDDYQAALRCARELGEPEIQRVTQLQNDRVSNLRQRLNSQRLLLARARSAEAGMMKQDMLDEQLGRAELMLTSTPPNIAAAATSLVEVRAEMGEMRGHAAIALQQRLDDLRDDGALPGAHYQRLIACLDKDDFDQVEYELFYIENGDEIPPDVASEIISFYPEVVDKLSGGLTHDNVTALVAGQTVAGIAWNLPAEQREHSGKALHGWINMPRATLTPFNFEATRDALQPVLRLLGLDVGPHGVVKIDADVAWGRGRRLLDVSARPKVRSQNDTQGAVIPAFGSLAEGRYRVLLAWDKPTIEDLNDWRELDLTLGPLIICYFGTVPAEHRLRLAREWHDASHRPTIIIDDAVLAAVAGSREPFSTTMALTMPFSSAAPFSSEKTPKVPVEMFYGRERIIRDIIRPDGPSLLYGGRGMGKSALLSVIQRRARANPAENLTVVWVELARSAEFDEPEVVWSKLSQGLEAEGVTSKARGVAAMRPAARVERILKEWLAANAGSRLLLLIDEADAFFSADARREFKETSALFAMANHSSRCKVVFAGLHSVAHHHGVGNNPFSPSGALPIGPLELSDAHRLLTRPLQALGYELEPNDARFILMYCNNQPYLIQLFATQLVNRLLRQRPRVGPDLPWPVPRHLVEEVATDRGLQDQIRGAFKITLDLDQRFGAIVYLIGLHAFDQGQIPLAESDLLDLCRSAWPKGFTTTTPTAFRELLKELEALGILGEAEPLRGGRTLRSSAVLRSLGSSREAIETNLREVRERALPEADARLQFRPSIGNADGRPGPLTSAQLADIAGRRGNRVRIVAGTELTGITKVVDSLRDPVHQPVLRDIQVTDGKSDYASLLRAGAAGEKRQTVVSPLYTLTHRTATCETALQKAFEMQPEKPGHTRAVALIAGPGNFDWLLSLASRGDCDELIVSLERMNQRSLPLHWRDLSGKLSPLGSDLADRTLAVTGGWPKLIDQISTRARKAGAATALDELETQQKEHSWPAQLLADAGVLTAPDDTVGTCDGVFLRVLRLLAELGGPCSTEDLLALAADEHISEATITLAQWLSLLEFDDDGLLRLAPLLADAFARWRESADR
jgi:hypothetical protein